MLGARRGCSLIDSHPVEFGAIGLDFIFPGLAKAPIGLLLKTQSA
jgi:hypothetical protein